MKKLNLKKVLLKRMMTTMTVIIMTMFAMPMMAQDEVWINGEEKTVYYVEVYPNVGFQNGFTIFLYLSPDKKEYINVMGDNTLHAGGFFYPVDITRYEIDFTDRCHWYVSYYKDNKVKVETCGNWRFDLDIFSEGRLTVSGGDPNSGRFGVDLWGIITQNTRGDGNTYEIKVDYRTDHERPEPGSLKLSTVTSNSIGLYWTHAEDNETPWADLNYAVSYIREKDQGLKDWELIPVGKANSYDIKNLEPSTVYNVEVIVEDGSGNIAHYETLGIVTSESAGIESVTSVVPTNKQGTFSLQGIKLTRQWDELPAGVYIVDGKKCVKK